MEFTPVKKSLFLLGVITFIFFVFFSYLVAKESFTKLDFDLTVKFQDSISSRWDLFFSTFSILGSAEITGLIWIVMTILGLIKRWWKTVFIGMPLFILALVIEIYGKFFVHHPSPPFLFYRGVIDFTFPSHFVHTDYSYPSGHMTRTAFLISFLLVLLQLKFHWSFRFPLQIGLVVILLIMTVSRIYLGEHWTSDVIGGLLLGSSFGILASVTLPLRLKKPDGLVLKDHT